MTQQNEQEHKPLVMVVDDNLEFLSGIELTLEMEGFRVLTASNGQHALDKLKGIFMGQGQEGGLEQLPDLIVADIMMPVMDGYAFYENVRANPYMNHIPFVFLSAKSSDVDVRYGKELGADDYLAKPFSPEDLLATIRGKLKRVEQRRNLAAQFTGDPSRPLEGRMVILITIIAVLVILAFCVGVLIPMPWN